MFRSRVHLPLILTIFLVTLVFSPTILPVRGPAYYTPGVIGGQWATYRQLYIRCNPPNPAICGSQGFNLDYGLFVVESVDNTQVTLNLATVSADGTGSHVGGLVDVATGYTNLTISHLPIQVPPHFPIVGANLQPGEKLWISAPYTVNKTISAEVAGQPRLVNVLNYTIPSSSGGVSIRVATEVWFDQMTGLLARGALSITTTIPSYPPTTTETDTAFGMTDNNIWSSPPSTSYPDFGISNSPPSVTTLQTSHANSTITITRMRGFNATVALSMASSSSSLTCTLSPTKLVKGGTDKSLLSCSGDPGSYTVTITGDSGYSTHTAQASINVGTASSSTSTSQTTQPTVLGILLNPTVDIGIAAAGVIMALLALLFTRRKPEPISQPTLGPTNPSTPPTQG